MESEKTSKGYVYVLINSSIPNLVKIGKTTKEPNERVKELSSATGVATPFILVYHRHFNNCHSAERKIHTLLEDKGARFSDSREFFEISTTDAINIIQNLVDDEVGNDFIDNSKNDTEKLWMVYHKKGNDYYFGENGCFQDYNKAIENYKKSAEYGYIQAHFIIGMTYKVHLENVRSAVKEFQIGAEKGDIQCYYQLARIYMTERNLINERNANIAWEKFFANLQKLDFDTLLECHLGYLSDVFNQNFSIDSRWYPTIQSLKNELITAIEKKENRMSIYSEVLKFLKSIQPDTDIEEFLVQYRKNSEENVGEIDPMFMEAAILIVKSQLGSTQLIQRKLVLGYNRAGRIMDQLEEFGIVGPAMGAKAREVKIRTLEELGQMFHRIGLFGGSKSSASEDVGEVSKQLEEENKQLEVESKQPEVASKENVKKKKSWLNKFFALLPSIALLLIIGVPVILLIYWISESSILSLLALILLIFLPFK